MDKFRKKAESISPTPSSKVWEQLEAQLDKQAPKKKTFRLYSIMGIAATLLLLVGVVLSNNFFNDSPTKQIAQAKKTENMPDKRLKITEESKDITIEVADSKEAILGLYVEIVYQQSETYQSFYEKVAEARVGGLLKGYGE